MSPIRLNLQRTFVSTKTPSDAHHEEFDEDFSSYLDKSPLGWEDLMAKPLLVVLGEAGSGKTWEFQDQAKRLRANGQIAFFIPLNKVTSHDTFKQALGHDKRTFRTWKSSATHAYFFLDAVDESRLQGANFFERSLQIIMNELAPHAARISVLLSSRISDWLLAPVRSAVDATILSTMVDTRTKKERSVHANGNVEEQDSNENLRVEAFTLAPLSEADAKSLAEAHGVAPLDTFWRAIQDGDYGDMVRHPRDVEWLARRWSQRHELGSYMELIEDGVAQRLMEHNDGYIAAGGVLSQEMLRAGAERLAAASVFCGKPFLSLPGEQLNDTDVDPALVLPSWNAKQHRRLLGVAVFDEATYGRVKFQHRSTREYLAAHWLHQLIGEGLPVPAAMELFGGAPYEESVLLNATRATLCWLAALNVSIREQIICKFPEMLMFEGDPTAWTEAEVVDAFQRYIVSLGNGFRPDWWSGIGELRRVAQCIPGSLLIQMLRSYADSEIVAPKLLVMIEHGHKVECAEEVFALYLRRNSSLRLALYALHVLPSIAGQKHRDAIKSDLLAKRLSGNDLLAAALQVVGLSYFDTFELGAIFELTAKEEDFGGGPMARLIIKSVADCSFEEAMSVIEALLKALPDQRGRSVDESIVEGEDRWKLYVLPACITRAVSQLHGVGEKAPSLLFQAAIFLERSHHGAHVTDKQISRLRKEIEAKPGYRRHLILCVARNGSIDTITGRLFLSSSPQINFANNKDLKQAIEDSLSSAVDSLDREIWFRIAEWLSFLAPKKEREKILKRLLSIGGEEGQHRKNYFEKENEIAEKSALRQATWRRRDAREKKKNLEALTDNIRIITKHIPQLSKGEHFSAIKHLVIAAEDRSGRTRYTRVNPMLIRRDYGRRIASAFDKGLTIFWKLHQAPDVLFHDNNQVPWTGLLGLASLNHAVRRGLDITMLSDEEVAQAVRYCVWELDGPAEWLSVIARTRAEVAVNALRPWMIHELRMIESQETSARTIELIFRSPSEMRISLLQEAVDIGRNGGIIKHRLCRQVFEHALDDGILDTTTAGSWTQSMLNLPHQAVPIDGKQDWLNGWFQFDVDAAWAWVRSHRDTMRTMPVSVAVCVSRALSSRRKLSDGVSATPTIPATLEDLYKFLTPYVDAELEATSIEDRHWHPVEQARNAIPPALTAMEGSSAHHALLRLKSLASSEAEAHWLQTFVLAHSVAEAQRLNTHAPKNLMNVGEVFCRDPKTAMELCQQVIARLNQIRTSVENGPFSDRLLFRPSMLEKHLQLWLAGRLNDTSNRKFSTRFAVHREPEVDDTKRTDIEVSSRGHKVCIEIKPVDKGRYTAAELRNTLERQLIKQYLKGGSNSRHGVLVIMLLEDKHWVIPGIGRQADFGQLMTYLSDYAKVLRAKYSEIEALQVVGIDCRQSISPYFTKPAA